jgi:hypothetical protein
MNTHNKPGGFTGSPASQRGAVIILFAVALVAILACAGLALDVSHQLINKTRLQNTVDAAALAGAKVLDQTADTALAAAAVQAMFNDNADDPGNFELNNASLTPIVQFSNTVAPFVPGTSPAMYVRVIQNGFVLPAWLIQVIGISQKTVGATAVAGPSPTINYSCNLVPLVICGDPAQDPSVPGNTYWGYVDGDIHRLKAGTDPGCQEPEIGPGNFQLAALGGNGADVVRENLAGGYNGCAFDGDTIPTQPGSQVGPVVQGINTRFNEFSGPISPGDYPPDVVTQEQTAPGLTSGCSVPTSNQYDPACPGGLKLNGTCVTMGSELDFNYDDYEARIAANNLDFPPPTGAFDRRSMPVFVADCTDAGGGKQDLPILSFGCFFLLQKSIQNGQQAEIFGEFAEECSTPGVAGPDPTIVPGPKVIQLYKDSDGNDA